MAMTEEDCQQLPSSFLELQQAIHTAYDTSRKLSGEREQSREGPFTRPSAREMLLHDVEKRTSSIASRVMSLYDGGDRITQYRLREMWRTQPDSMSMLCDDLERFNDNSSFRVLLRTKKLYAAYKKKLAAGDGDYRQHLEQIAAGSNHYLALGELLLEKNLEDKANQSPVLRQKALDIDEGHVPQGDYRRIVVFGGQYAREAKDKIKGASNKLPIEIFDLFTKRESIENLHPGDLVIYVTTSTNHPLYAAVKRHCRARDIELYHLHRSGHNPLIGIIQQVAPPS